MNHPISSCSSTAVLRGAPRHPVMRRTESNIAVEESSTSATPKLVTISITELLAALSSQSRPVVFPGFDMAAREIPNIGVGATIGATVAEQHAPAVLQHAAYHPVPSVGHVN